MRAAWRWRSGAAGVLAVVGVLAAGQSWREYRQVTGQVENAQRRARDAEEKLLRLHGEAPRRLALSALGHRWQQQGFWGAARPVDWDEALAALRARHGLALSWQFQPERVVEEGAGYRLLATPVRFTAKGVSPDRLLKALSELQRPHGALVVLKQFEWRDEPGVEPVLHGVLEYLVARTRSKP